MDTYTSFPNVEDRPYMSLTTFRKTGAPVPTPVWFVRDNQHLYVFTGGSSGKVKRLRNNNRVEVAPCNREGTILGESLPGTARIIADHETALIERIERLMDQKYGSTKRFMAFISRLVRAFSGTPKQERTYLEVIQN